MATSTFTKKSLGIDSPEPAVTPLATTSTGVPTSKPISIKRPRPVPVTLISATLPEAPGAREESGCEEADMS